MPKYPHHNPQTPHQPDIREAGARQADAQAKAGARIPSRTPLYAELHCLTNFSFLRGASHPAELVERAAEFGYTALAITDRHSLAGVVRAHQAAREHNLHLLIGAELMPIDAPPLILLAPDRPAYARLARLLTRGKLRTPKGQCAICLQDLADLAPGLIAIVLPDGIGVASCHSERSEESGCVQASDPDSSVTPLLRNDSRVPPLGTSPPRPLDPSIPRSLDPLHAYREIFADALYLAAELAYDVPDDVRLAQLAELSRQTGIPLVAANNVHYHVPERRYLQDVLTCIREQCTIAEAGTRLLPNAERHLRPLDEIARRYAACPELIARTVEIAQRCTFSLDDLKYEYPHELCPENLTATCSVEKATPGVIPRSAATRNLAPRRRVAQPRGKIPPSSGRRDDSVARPSHKVTPTEFLAKLTWEGAHERYPDHIPSNVRQQIDAELALINDLNYEPYFLTVWDLARFARRRGILCQGRGSAANSAVCYCLGITAVDPARIDLLFERFISRERNEPPDIDVDFEHQRREEVFQYIYEKYGRERAAITGEVITYRPRSAVRDVGKVLGLSLDRIDVLAKSLDWWDRKAVPEEVITAAGLDPHDRTIQMLVRLVRQILRFPRHLSQHVGGFVITESPLCEIVPLENAAMPQRTFIEWDKNDIDALGILKVDCLALGMLTAISKCFKLLNSNEATERRSDEGVWNQGDYNDGEDLSRSDCVAKSHGAGQGSISRYDTNAGFGEVRPDQPDAPSRGVDPIEHRRRTWPAKPAGLHPISADSARLANGTANSVNPRRRTEFSPSSAGTPRAPGGNGSRSASPDPQPGKPPEISPSSLRRSVASSLCLSPSCFRASVPSCLTDLPPEDPTVYNMICAADTVGVFQIESRAQMSMLPRLRPRCFYDLVIEVAIVRPGPIQGGMVHPYLRRRSGLEPVTYPSEEVRQVLAKTLGVPLFQEQVMRLAVVAAGFTPGEADQLRRAMAAWQRSGTIEKFQLKLIKGMLARGYSKAFAEQIYLQIRGFGEYGFPESHAASFALLVYASAWLKRYHPAAFCAALLNSQPLGFYTPGQLVRDALAHGVPVLPVDVNCSGWDCTLEHRTRSTSEGPIRTRSASEGPIRTRSVSEGPIRTRSASEGPIRTRSVSEGQNHEVTERRSNEKEPRTSVRPVLRHGKTSSGRKTGRAEARGSSCAAITASTYVSVPASRYAHPNMCDNPSVWGKHGPALRLGMRLVRGLSEEKVLGLIAERESAAQRTPSSLRGSVASSLHEPVASSLSLTSIRQLFRRGDVSRETLLRLAAADAFRSLGLDRRQALWHILAQADAEPPLFAELEPDEPAIALPAMSPDETVVQDYDAIGFSLSAHPIGLVRGELDGMRIRHEKSDGATERRSDGGERQSDGATEPRSDGGDVAAGPCTGREEPRTSVRPVLRNGKASSRRKTGRAEARGSSKRSGTQHNPRTQRGLRIVPNDRLKLLRNGQPVAVAGLVTLRQRPGTAKGIVFMTLEDETGMANLVIRPAVWERDRRIARGKIALIAEGHIERQGEVVHVIVRRFHDLSEQLARVTHRSRDFH